MPKIIQADPFPLKKGDVVTIGTHGRKPYRIIRINSSGESAFVEREDCDEIESVMVRTVDLHRYHGSQQLPKESK